MNQRLNAIISEYKEYAELEIQLKAQMEVLKTEAIELLGSESIDEYTCEAGKITYREVLSNRFATTEFKKLHADLYRAFTTQTRSLRFTCN